MPLKKYMDPQQAAARLNNATLRRKGTDVYAYVGEVPGEYEGHVYHVAVVRYLPYRARRPVSVLVAGCRFYEFGDARIHWYARAAVRAHYPLLSSDDWKRVRARARIMLDTIIPKAERMAKRRGWI